MSYSMLKAFGAVFTGLVIVIIGSFVLSQKQAPPPPITDHEYYWGDGCEECAKVQIFLDNWDGRDKVKIEKLETWNNEANATQMSERARACKLSPKDAKVPLLVTPQGQCLSGETSITSYFASLHM